MKAGWTTAKVGEVCAVIAGQSPSSSAYNERGEGLPFFQGKKEFTERFLGAQTVWTNEVTKRAEPGDIVMSVRAPVGPINEVTRTICIGRGLAAIRASTRISKDFLWYSLLNLQPKITGSAGAVFPSISRGDIEELELSLPPLEEQHRIVALLDEAFEGLSRARANAEANLADTRELFAAVLREEFNSDSAAGDCQPLSSLGTVVTGSTPPTSDKQNYGTDIPFVKPGDFLPDGQLDIRADGLSKQGAMLARILPPGCALMVCIGATIGKAGFSDRAIATNQQINALIPNAGIDAEFIYLQMILPEFQRQVRQNAGQATLPIINKSKWSALKVWIPRDPADQFRITSKMREIRALLGTVELHYLRATEEGEQLRQVILQRAFTGELT